MNISSIKKNLFYNFLYQILVVALPLITTPYISRILGANKIGLYSYAYSIAYYFVIFIMLGLNNYGNRTIAAVKNDKQKLSQSFFSIYYMQLITGIVMIVIYIIYGILSDSHLMYWIMLLYVISGAVDINWFFFGLEQFQLTVVRNTIIKIITTVCIFVFVKSSSDIYLYGVLMTLGILLSQLLLWPFVRRYVDFCKVSFKDVANHIRPNLVLFVPVIAVSLYKIMDKIMLGNMSSMTEVGLYESSEKVIQIPLALVASLGTVMLPRITNMIANNKDIKNYFSYSISFAMFLSTSICFGIMAVADLFVPIFYGSGYEKCIILFQILLPSCIFLAFSDVLRTQYLIPLKKDKIFIQSVSLGAIVNIIINLFLIPQFQSIGAAIGTLMAEIAVCLYQAVRVRKEVDINKYFVQSLPFVISGILMYLVLIFIPNKNYNIIFLLLAKIFIGFFVYILSLLLQMKVFNKHIKIVDFMNRGG